MFCLLNCLAAAETPEGAYILGPHYHVDPVFANTTKEHGTLYKFTLPMKGSKYYDCTEATNSQTFDSHPCNLFRNVSVYIPKAYQDGAEAALLVTQDGPAYDDMLPQIMDVMIPSRLPVFIYISVSTGTKFDGTGSLRDFQYDDVSGKYAAFIDDEILSAVKSNKKIRADFPNIKITSNPDGRATMGCSSGGAAAMEMAWWRPDLFRRVVAYSPTLVRKDTALPSNLTFPLGAWAFPSLIKSIPKKPIRVFHSVNQYDLGTTGLNYSGCEINYQTGVQKVVTASEGCFSAPDICKGTAGEGRWVYHNTMDPLHSNWIVANNATQISLQEQGYETRFAYAVGVCHCDMKVLLQDVPSTLEWAWRGWGS